MNRVRPCRRPLPKVHQKVIKNGIRKMSRILTENGLPKGPSKSQKSHKICKMGASNAFRELLCPLSVQKRFSNRLQTPPEPQKLRFYCSNHCFQKSTLPTKLSLLDPFWEPFGTTFPPMSSLMAPKVPKRTLSKNNKKTIKFWRPNWLQNDF